MKKGGKNEKKIIMFLSSLLLVTTSSAIIACNNKDENQYLVITDKEIGSKVGPGPTGVISDIAFNFMYNLPLAEQPKLDRTDFGWWTWQQSADLKTVYGRVIGDISTVQPVSHEYWEVTIKKTKLKGLFVDT